MYCSRCGTQNEPGDRFCSSCGASLQGGDAEQKPRRSLRERIGAVIGTSRKAQLATLGTVLALAIAIAAFIALKPSDDGDGEIPRDAYTIAADNICVTAKQKIVGVEQEALKGQDGGEAALGRLVPVISGWRGEFEAMRVPIDRTDQARHVSEALRQVEIQLSGLALAADEGQTGGAVASAKKVDEASAEVETAISELGLTHCARQTIGFDAAKPN
jgi:zinc-ribbon domain